MSLPLLDNLTYELLVNTCTEVNSHSFYSPQKPPVVFLYCPVVSGPCVVIGYDNKRDCCRESGYVLIFFLLRNSLGSAIEGSTILPEGPVVAYE